MRANDTVASAAGKVFLGIGTAGSPPSLVVCFETTETKQRYYMTMQELCDWIEHQMSSGLYHTVRDGIAVDRAALQALIEAQRKVLMGKKTLDDFGLVEDGAASFAHYVLTTYGPMAVSSPTD